VELAAGFCFLLPADEADDVLGLAHGFVGDRARTVGAVDEDGIDMAGIGDPSRARRPRVHDLRHAFAVRTLVGWHRDGLDVAALLPRLSTYLGHREPRYTYRYLTATPELLGLAAAMLEADAAVIR